MAKFVMLGMSEEHARFMLEMVKKEIESLDIVFEKVKDCSGLDWLQNRRKIAEETKSLLTSKYYANLVIFCI